MNNVMKHDSTNLLLVEEQSSTWFLSNLQSFFSNNEKLFSNLKTISLTKYFSVWSQKFFMALIHK